jgi:hypothetical protein
MAPALATELLELIVDSLEYDEQHIQDLLSLCSTARGFVRCCQIRLFRNVTLYHPISSRRPEVSRVYLRKFKKGLLFVQSVTQRPDLALYVKMLEYWMPSDIVGGDPG